MRVDRQPWERTPKPKPDYPTLPPALPPTRPEFIERAMIGRMSLEDQAYMARAILALSDENAEMKERIKALELVVQRLVLAEAVTLPK